MHYLHRIALNLNSLLTALLIAPRGAFDNRAFDKTGALPSLSDLQMELQVISINPRDETRHGELYQLSNVTIVFFKSVLGASRSKSYTTLKVRSLPVAPATVVPVLAPSYMELYDSSSHPNLTVFSLPQCLFGTAFQSMGSSAHQSICCDEKTEIVLLIC